MTHEELALVLSVADAIGSVGILLVVVWALYTGRVIPAAVVDLLCEQAAQEAMQAATGPPPTPSAREGDSPAHQGGNP